MLMIELEHDRVVVVVHVVKHKPISLIKRAGSENAGNIRPRKTETLPPSSGRVGIGADRFDMRQWNIQLRLQRPEPVPPLHLEVNAIAAYGDLNHQNTSSWIRGRRSIRCSK